MLRQNRDTAVSIGVLILLGFFYAASYSIPETTFNSIQAGIWPRVVIVFTAFWAVVYLVQSLRNTDSPIIGSSGGVHGFVAKYANPIGCFFLFGVFIAVLPYLGIIISGILCVFSFLVFIGQRNARMLAIYGVTAVITVVGFWAVFTFLLGVMLPEGKIFEAL